MPLVLEIASKFRHSIPRTSLVSNVFCPPPLVVGMMASPSFSSCLRMHERKTFERVGRRKTVPIFMSCLYRRRVVSTASLILLRYPSFSTVGRHPSLRSLQQWSPFSICHGRILTPYFHSWWCAEQNSVAQENEPSAEAVRYRSQRS